jgi:hypothetical protein
MTDIPGLIPAAYSEAARKCEALRSWEYVHLRYGASDEVDILVIEAQREGD